MGFGDNEVGLGFRPTPFLPPTPGLYLGNNGGPAPLDPFLMNGNGIKDSPDSCVVF